ncbi:ATP-dependent RNA helicase RhlE [Lewinella marina]|uniref:DNA/RNA helicase n=1 Tax=Neolewinella marina TaxID=438751 RepID=A0A2G0CF14_9BACT|nr:DEAD/DEAH box helicase [Neolewinella marina]NJB85773.1 ATP-dependent RNA helicase RhlE [Neolewinella marina]PHK98555.1 DNA/RNA helicase [Neolewinella marina]
MDSKRPSSRSGQSRSNNKPNRSGGKRRPSGGGGGGNRDRRGSGGGRSNHNYIPLPAEMMVHEGVALKTVEYRAETKYADWPINAKLKSAIKAAGWVYPTEIQEKSFEHVAAMKDVMGIATTGTGKTGAFLIPLIDALLESEQPFQTLVLAPTRELALQIEDEFRALTLGMKYNAITLIGGRNINTDIVNLKKRSYHLVVATPGRLKDLYQQGKIDLQEASVLVLDEFDRMLDMGFQKDVMFLTDKMGDRDQTMLFSATLDKSQQKLIDHFLTDYVTIKVSSGEVSAEHINQTVKFVAPDDKFDALIELMQQPEMKRVLVFAETKHRVKKVTKKLNQAGISADEIHGNKSQNYRQKALNAFKAGKIKALCATDVAARGLDIDDITHVVNFEAPTDYDTYIHRVGRTGRAGKGGEAITFYDK